MLTASVQIAVVDDYDETWILYGGRKKVNNQWRGFVIALEKYTCQSTIEKEIDAVLSVTKIYTYRPNILG